DAPGQFSGNFEHDDSDFIIRSGDGVDFHVQKAYIKPAHFFRGLLNPPNGQVQPHEWRDGKPVVVLAQPSDVWFRLLSLVYPPCDDSLDQYSLGEHNLDGVNAMHEAADFYGFERVMKLLEKMLAAPALLDSHPHRVFVIARLRGMDNLACAAALHTLNTPVCPPGLRIPELELLPGGAFQRLHDFHHACG
ncbi:hypothetical protein DFH06DRAFT_910927, partial [Mycena polygramma]